MNLAKEMYNSYMVTIRATVAVFNLTINSIANAMADMVKGDVVTVESEIEAFNMNLTELVSTNKDVYRVAQRRAIPRIAMERFLEQGGSYDHHMTQVAAEFHAGIKDGSYLAELNKCSLEVNKKVASLIENETITNAVEDGIEYFEGLKSDAPTDETQYRNVGLICECILDASKEVNDVFANLE